MGEAGDRLTAAAIEAAALRESINALIDTIMSAAPKEEKRWKNATWLLIIGGPVLFVLTLGLTTYTTMSLLRIESRLNHGISCLLADTDDHRYTNQAAHNQLAAQLHVQIDQPDIKPLSPEQVVRLKRECALFTGPVGPNASRR
jgi:hypothetical protein